MQNSNVLSWSAASNLSSRYSGKKFKLFQCRCTKPPLMVWRSVPAKCSMMCTISYNKLTFFERSRYWRAAGTLTELKPCSENAWSHQVLNISKWITQRRRITSLPPASRTLQSDWWSLIFCRVPRIYTPAGKSELRGVVLSMWRLMSRLCMSTPST